MPKISKLQKCSWPGSYPLMIDYHDKEWGRPVHDDKKHTVMYAHMQAVGMVNDHTTDCFCHRELTKGNASDVSCKVLK